MALITENDSFRLLLNETSRLFTLEFPGHAAFVNFSCALHYQVGDEPKPRTLTLRGEEVQVVEGNPTVLRLEPTPDRPGLSAEFGFDEKSITISLEVQNETPAPIRIVSVDPLYGIEDEARVDLAGKSEKWRFLKNGFSVVEPTRAVTLNDRENKLGMRLPWWMVPRFIKYMVYNYDYRPRKAPGNISSEWFTLLSPPDSSFAVLLGFTGFRRHFSRIEIDAARSLINAGAIGDYVRLPARKNWQAEEFFITVDKDHTECLDRYAKRAVEKAGGARFRKTTLWCTWYSGKYNKIDQPYIEKNLEKLSDYRDKIEYVQIDDGYQESFGEWTQLNKKFTGTLDDLAGKIRDAGFLPGIWSAPFCISGGNPIFREHPDWLIKTEKGKPKTAGVIAGLSELRFYYALDCTNPEVLEWIEELYSKLAGYGFEIFKIDFLTAAALGGLRFDPEFTRAEAYHKGLQAIRRGVGDKKVLLSAISPWMANIGLVDIVRVSPDSAFGKPAWHLLRQKLLRDDLSPGLRNNMRNTITRAFTHNVLWTNDPDAIFNEGLSEAEIRSQHTAALLMGSAITVGNNFEKNSFKFLHIEELMKYQKVRARVVDLMDKEIPEEVVVDALRDEKRFFLYALFNWSSHTVSRRVNIQQFLPTYHLLDNKEIFDYWERRMKRFEPGEEIELAPHDCKLYIISADKE
jgi:Melibiase